MRAMLGCKYGHGAHGWCCFEGGRGNKRHAQAVAEDMAALLEDVQELIHLERAHVLYQGLEPVVVENQRL